MRQRRAEARRALAECFERHQKLENENKGSPAHRRRKSVGRVLTILHFVWDRAADFTQCRRAKTAYMGRGCRILSGKTLLFFMEIQQVLLFARVDLFFLRIGIE